MSRSSFEQVVEGKSVEFVIPKVPAFIPSAMVHGRTIRTKVVGCSFEGRQEVVAKLHEGDRVWLEREPSNPYDFKAIKVSRSDGAQFGFINRSLAAALSAYFDAYGKPVRGKVLYLTGSSLDGYLLGAVVFFKLPKLHPNHRQHRTSFTQWENEEGGQND